MNGIYDCDTEGSWRFELRQRHPGQARIPSGWVVGFGAWQPGRNRVIVCRLDRAELNTLPSIDTLLHSLEPDIALVWGDLMALCSSYD